MSDQQPIKTTNLDIYGHAELPWSRAHDLLASSPSGPDLSFFLGTVRPDGRPHVAAVGALWHAGDLYIVSGPGTQKSRNLAANSACTIAVKLAGLDLTLEGEATRITDPATLEVLAGLYRGVGWPVHVEGDAFSAPYSAPSAGTPPWYLYRFVARTAVGVATAEPHGATRWRFAV